MMLKDKVAIVTGSSRGIGKATVLELAKHGAKIVVNYRESDKKAEEVVEEIKSIGSDAIAVKADVTRPNDVKEMVRNTIEKFGKIDILVNNAGIIKPKPFFELTVEDWEKNLRTNLIGVFLCSQEVARAMSERKKGKIINVASIRGLPHCGRKGIMDYSASKAAVINFTKTLAKELAPHINVNAVAPGFAETDIAKNWDEKVRESATKDTYLERLVQVKEIAKAIVYLASDDSDSMTGHVLVIDSGYSLK
ncbi:MAG: glucose 1-dehydrogenase [Candidatus Aenigmarchaeota archaeon]|nr:glucose 1-dehydrogenase [Candidatus Aenigmarchaeota archaeon]